MALLIYLALCVAIGIWAHRYDRAGILWALLSFVTTPLIGGVFLLAVGPRTAPTQRCPDCGERVNAYARVCRYCGHQFPPRIYG